MAGHEVRRGDPLMPAREAYARGWVQRGDVECSVGVEIREGDDVDDMTRWVKRFAWTALALHGGNHSALVKAVEWRVKYRYPGRAYFVETEEDGKGVQVFQPFGLPRDR